MIRTLAYSKEAGVMLNVDLDGVYCNGESYSIVWGSRRPGAQQPDILWLDIENPNHEEYSLLENRFKFHYLALEDCRYLRNRSKLDEYSGYAFLILQVLLARNKRNRLEFGELKIFLGENYLVTIHHQPMSFLDEVYDRCQRKREVMSKGVDFIFYTVLDALVD